MKQQNLWVFHEITAREGLFLRKLPVVDFTNKKFVYKN